MVQLAPLAGAATIIAALLSLMGAAYAYGRRTERRQSFHEELRQAHHNAHSDQKAIIDALNQLQGFHKESTFDTCPTCQEIEEGGESAPAD